MGRQSPNELPLFAGTAAFCGALRDGGTLITALPLLLSVRACMRVRVCVSPSTPAHELAPVQGQEVNILAGGPERSAVYRISSVGERGWCFFRGGGTSNFSVQVEAENALAARHQEATACSSSPLPFAGGAAASSASSVVVVSAVPALFFPLASPTCLCVTGACCCDLQPRNNQQPQLGFLPLPPSPFCVRGAPTPGPLRWALPFSLGGWTDSFVADCCVCVRVCCGGGGWCGCVVWKNCLNSFLGKIFHKTSLAPL